MFETICNLIPRDPQYPGRGRTLDILKRVLDGRLYEVLPYQFHEERGAGGEYIPLRNRRPSVHYASVPHCGGGQRFASCSVRGISRLSIALTVRSAARLPIS